MRASQYNSVNFGAENSHIVYTLNPIPRIPNPKPQIARATDRCEAYSLRLALSLAKPSAAAADRDLSGRGVRKVPKTFDNVAGLKCIPSKV